MTAHELAKKLLEGPDVEVCYVNRTYEESEVCIVDTIDKADFWQYQQWKDAPWSEPIDSEPHCADKRKIRLVKLS